MTHRTPHRTSYLTRRLDAAHQVLADPCATDAQRHQARCRINRFVALVRVPPAMRRPFEVDRLAERQSRRHAAELMAANPLGRRRGSSAAATVISAALIASSSTRP